MAFITQHQACVIWDNYYNNSNYKQVIDVADSILHEINDVKACYEILMCLYDSGKNFDAYRRLIGKFLVTEPYNNCLAQALTVFEANYIRYYVFPNYSINCKYINSDNTEILKKEIILRYKRGHLSFYEVLDIEETAKRLNLEISNHFYCYS